MERNPRTRRLLTEKVVADETASVPHLRFRHLDVVAFVPHRPIRTCRQLLAVAYADSRCGTVGPTPELGAPVGLNVLEMDPECRFHVINDAEDHTE